MDAMNRTMLESPTLVVAGDGQIGGIDASAYPGMDPASLLAPILASGGTIKEWLNIIVPELGTDAVLPAWREHVRELHKGWKSEEGALDACADLDVNATTRLMTEWALALVNDTYRIPNPGPGATVHLNEMGNAIRRLAELNPRLAERVMRSLPAGLEVAGTLWIRGANSGPDSGWACVIPDGLRAKGGIRIDFPGLSKFPIELGSGLRLGDDLRIVTGGNSPLHHLAERRGKQSLPAGLEVHGDLDLYRWGQWDGRVPDDAIVTGVVKLSEDHALADVDAYRKWVSTGEGDIIVVKRK
jgi:hypothetical protein